MKNTPSISVIMPVYNAEKHIKQSIESVLSQTYESFEFIIIDDGSTDASCNIVRSFSDPRIKLYQQDHRGVADSLNKGIALSTTDIIARQDADDISHPERFEKQFDFLSINKDVGLLGTSANLINDKGDTIKSLDFPCDNDALQKYIKNANPFIHGSVFMRKKCLKSVGLYRQQFLLAQSYDMWLRLSERYEIANLSEKLYQYRVWDNAVSNKKAALFSLFCTIAIDLYNERNEKGIDLLMTGNNYEFYMKYGPMIIDTCGKSETFRWLKDS